MSEILDKLKAQRNKLYPQLEAAYIENQTEEYSRLKQEIKILNEQISSYPYEPDEKEERTGKNFSYSQSLGVYVANTAERSSPEQLKMAEMERKSIIKRLHGPADQITDKDREFRKVCLKDCITGKQWLNNLQVEAATGTHVPVGTVELGEFLSKNMGNLPVSFGYIIEGENNDNHFASGRISKTNKGMEFIYVDSNGDLMPAAERKVLESKFPGVEVTYLDRNGGKISEAHAIEAYENNPEKILRVQFDDHNCGLYTTHIVNMLNRTEGNPKESDIAQIKEITKNPSLYRAELSEALLNMANAKSPAEEKLMQKEFSEKSFSKKLSEQSPAVSDVSSFTKVPSFIQNAHVRNNQEIRTK